ncbi:uncharacterized protein [Aquarana catesbeiana]|uniref:uncharacterized protein n=1 Tax=Aquarana catesbeiana TaxID=8400 RepID=UPI003CC9AEB0
MTRNMKILVHFYQYLLLGLLHLILLTGGKNHTSVEQPILITAEPENNVTIECKVTHQMHFAHVTWTLGCEGGQPIREGGKVVYSSSKHKITIMNLTESDSGIYCCHVEIVDGKKARGKGTRLEVTNTSCSESTGLVDTGGDHHGQVNILYTVIGLLICVIIVLLAVLMKYCHTGPPTSQKRDHKEEAETEFGLHYAEISKKNAAQCSRTRHTEDPIIYAAIKTHQ